MGSNGPGKSTLLNTISGRLLIDSGSITIDGAEVSRMPEYKRAKYLGRVFHDPMAGTAPDLTIEQNLSLALKRGKTRGLGRGTTPARRELFADELATLELGLENRLKTKVGMLSGGQRQALSLLRAGFTQPRILLLDEHTAALDPQWAALVTALTKETVANDELTTLMVTHNMEQAIALGNKLIMMHEGEIIYQASVEEKKDLTVETLLGEFSKLKGAALGDAHSAQLCAERCAQGTEHWAYRRCATGQRGNAAVTDSLLPTCGLQGIIEKLSGSCYRR